MILHIGLLAGCEQYKELTNDPPKVTSFTVPAEVAYGETVIFRIRVFDPEEDPLTYSSAVSHGTLRGEAAGPEVQWRASESPDEEAAPPISVTVNIAVGMVVMKKFTKRHQLSSFQNLSKLVKHSAAPIHSFPSEFMATRLK